MTEPTGPVGALGAGAPLLPSLSPSLSDPPLTLGAAAGAGAGAVARTLPELPIAAVM